MEAAPHKTLLHKTLWRVLVSGLLLMGFALVPAPSSTAQGEPVQDAQAQDEPTPAATGPEITEYTLDNGLSVILVADHSAPTVAVNLWYAVGGADDPPDRSGFAHLFEHMMFQGSASVEPGQHAEWVNAAGGFYNATTGLDRTNYFEVLPSHQLPLGLWLEAERLRSLRLTEENFAREVEVVKEEYRLRVENQPYGEALLALQTVPFDYEPYTRPVIGSIEDLERATLDEIRAFHAAYYVPNNATLAVVGDIDPAQARQLIEEYFGDIPAGEPPPALPAYSYTPQASATAITMTDEIARVPATLIGYRLPPRDDPDYYALEVLARILGAGRSSRLAQALIDTGLAADASTTINGNRGPSLFAVILVPNAGIAPEQLERIYHDELARLQREGVSDEELEKAVNQIRTETARQLEQVFFLAESVQRANFYLGDPNAVLTDLARYQAVTSDAVQAAATRYLAAEQENLIRVLPAAPSASPQMVPTAPPVEDGLDEETDEGAEGTEDEEAPAEVGSAPWGALRLAVGVNIPSMNLPGLNLLGRLAAPDQHPSQQEPEITVTLPITGTLPPETGEPTGTVMPTGTAMPTGTGTPVTATPGTGTPTPATGTPTEVTTGTPTPTPGETGTGTPVTGTPTATGSITPSPSPIGTQTVTATVPATVTATVTPTVTGTVTATPSITPSPTTTLTPTATLSPTLTATFTPTSTATITATTTVTATVTGTATATPTTTQTVAPTGMPSVTPSVTPPVTGTTGTPSVTPSVTPTGSPTIPATGTPTGPVSAPPTPLPVAELTLPTVVSETLDNGMTVLIVPDGSVPLVTLYLVVPGGGSVISADKAGLATITANLLTRGTESRSAQEIAATIEQIGGVLFTGANGSTTTIFASLLSEYADVAFDLVGDVARHPTFPENELATQRLQVLTTLQSLLSNPDAVAARVFDRIVYGDHPYGYTATEETIQSITREDVLAAYAAQFDPARAILVIAGDMTPDEALAHAEETFGDWESSGEAEPVTFPPLSERSQQTIYLVDQPDTTQTTIYLGHLGIGPDSPDRFAVQLVDHILGGGPSSRLFRKLREEEGFTYGVGSYFDTPLDRGTFVVQTSVRNQVVADALNAILDELNTLRETPPPAQELADAQAYLVGSYALRLETAEALADALVALKLAGLPLEEVETYPQSIQAVDAQALAEAAQTHLRPDQLAIVVVGDAEAIEAQLAEIAPVVRVDTEGNPVGADSDGSDDSDDSSDNVESGDTESHDIESDVPGG